METYTDVDMKEAPKKTHSAGPTDFKETIDKLYNEAVAEFGYKGTKDEFTFMVSNYAFEEVAKKNSPNRATRRAMKRGKL